MGKLLITRDDCNPLFKVFGYRGLRAADDISELAQKCDFALSKPLFSPLNYGNNFRDRISDSDINARASRVNRARCFIASTQ
jgi:hypothetical protein